MHWANCLTKNKLYMYRYGSGNVKQLSHLQEKSDLNLTHSLLQNTQNKYVPISIVSSDKSIHIYVMQHHIEMID